MRLRRVVSFDLAQQYIQESNMNVLEDKILTNACTMIRCRLGNIRSSLQEKVVSGDELSVVIRENRNDLFGTLIRAATELENLGNNIAAKKVESIANKVKLGNLRIPAVVDEILCLGEEIFNLA